ncbi:hypothetical protein [Streptosporangium roseum]|uniref:hypothetical protein n=1 Tax=Streptosporangium roseum TaxID=2001 RepID=UPI00332D482B
MPPPGGAGTGGSSAERGARLRADAEQAGAGDRLDFLRADLSSIAENDRVIDHVTARHPAIDALVKLLARFAARSIDQVVPPLSGLLDTPPLQPLTAVDRGRTAPLTLRTFDPADARRLARLTEEFLTSRRTPR